MTGKTTKLGVQQILGPPDWSGHPEDAEDAPVTSMLAYEYQVDESPWERVALWMNAKSGVVETILLEAQYPRGATISEALALKASRKFPVMNGPIDCRLLKYDLY